MVPHSSTLAWKIPWTKEPGGLQSMGREESDTTDRLSLSLSTAGASPSLWCSHMSFNISLPTYTHTKKTPQTDPPKKKRIFIRTASDLWVDVGRTGLCTALTLLICEHSITFCLFKPSSHLETEMAATPVLLPGESHGRRSLVGCSPWVAKGQT